MIYNLHEEISTYIKVNSIVNIVNYAIYQFEEKTYLKRHVCLSFSYH